LRPLQSARTRKDVCPNLGTLQNPVSAHFLQLFDAMATTYSVDSIGCALGRSIIFSETVFRLSRGIILKVYDRLMFRRI